MSIIQYNTIYFFPCVFEFILNVAAVEINFNFNCDAVLPSNLKSTVMLSNRKRPSSWVSKVRNSAADIPYFTFSYHKHRFQDVHKTHFNTYILLYTQTLLFALLIFSAVHVNNPPSIPTLTTSYVHGTSSHSLLSSTVDQCLQRSVERHPDREALVFMQDRIRKTFDQFYQDVSDFSSFFFFDSLIREVYPVRLEILTTVLPFYTPHGRKENHMPKVCGMRDLGQILK